MKPLVQIGQETGTDKFQHGYLPHYERHISPIALLDVTVLEIGVAKGASIRMWAQWFTHPSAVIHGVETTDIVDPPFDDPRISVFFEDIKTVDLANLEPTYDLIVDDGSHLASDIVAAYQRLWKLVRPGGWYVIEDLYNQWSSAGEGGPEGSTASRMIEDILRLIFCDDSRISEFHAYPKVLLLRKALFSPTPLYFAL